MNISKRQSEILKILETNRYVSVNELSKLTYTSPSSIRRDLSHLEDLGLVNRSYGGVALPEMSGRVAGFYNRTTKNIKETWRAMEYLYKQKKVRAIGVCNCNVKQLESIIEFSEINPMVNQRSLTL